MIRVGFTERGDAARDFSWLDWVVKGNPAVLITKNPTILRLFLEQQFRNSVLSDVCMRKIIIHCTITGFGGTIVEPNVPTVDKSISDYIKFVQMFGVDRVVLRVDPIIPTTKGIMSAMKVIELAKIEIPNPRVRISFLDLYPHVKNRFRDASLQVPKYAFHAPLELRKTIWNLLDKPEVCGEPEMECTGCISKKDCLLLGISPSDSLSKQRGSCSCLGNKVELLDNKKQCSNGCIYCYWK